MRKSIRLLTWFPTIAFLVFCLPVFRAQAQSELKVVTATLASTQSVVGKLAVLSDRLLFVDDENPATSFLVDKANILSANADGEAITLQLNQPILDRAGSANRVILRLPSVTDALSLVSWFNASGAGANGTANTAAPAAGDPSVLTYNATRKKFLRGNTQGKLIVDGARIIFESTANASESRRWELKEIREFKQDNPFEIVITSSGGEKYSLILEGKGMDSSEYREISDRITKARTAK
ncbi:MAG: hypothetical protein NW208_01110 [Bryobacter sp.]|nr:hypothetical protein [Bryobacter sp.]